MKHFWIDCSETLRYEINIIEAIDNLFETTIHLIKQSFINNMWYDTKSVQLSLNEVSDLTMIFSKLEKLLPLI